MLFTPRPSQSEILAYRGGTLGISAVLIRQAMKSENEPRSAPRTRRRDFK